MNDVAMTRALTRDVLEDIAPGELFVLEHYSPGADTSGSTSRGPQGFGGNGALILLTPFLYKFFEGFLNRLAIRAADGGWDLVRDWISGSKAVPHEEIEAIVKSNVGTLGLPQERLDEVAASITQALLKKRGVLGK